MHFAISNTKSQYFHLILLDFKTIVPYNLFQKIREAEYGAPFTLQKGDDAYVIRTSISTIHLHIIYLLNTSNCCRSCLIYNNICYSKKIGQKKHISA